MKTLFVRFSASAVFVLLAFAAQGQRLAIGEKVPEVKGVAWQGDRVPQGGKATLVDFFHSANSGCIKALPVLEDIQAKHPGLLNVVVVSREDPSKVAQLGEGKKFSFFICYDETGKVFSSYGVRIVPFSVLADRQGRLVWMGNVSSLTPEIIGKALK